MNLCCPFCGVTWEEQLPDGHTSHPMASCFLGGYGTTARNWQMRTALDTGPRPSAEGVLTTETLAKALAFLRGNKLEIG